jgi:hypothetical protein
MYIITCLKNKLMQILVSFLFRIIDAVMAIAAKISGHENRIQSLEALDVQQLETRVAELEVIARN